MRKTKGEITRALLSVVVLCWSALALLCSLQIVLPAQTFTLWWLTVLAKEFSLLVATFAVLGTVLAALAGSIGAPKRVMVAAALSVATIFLSLMPVMEAWRTASAEGISLSLAKHFVDLSRRGPSTGDGDVHPS